MGYIKLVFLLGILLYSTWVIGQDANFEFEKGQLAIHGIKKLVDHQLVIKANDTKVYDLSGGKLYKYDLEGMKSVPVWPYTWTEYFRDNIINLERINNKVIIPLRIGAGNNVHYALMFTPKDFLTMGLSAKKIDFSVDSGCISSANNAIGEFCITSGENRKVDLLVMHSKLGVLNIKKSSLDCLLINSVIDSFILSDIKFSDRFGIESTPLPKYIQLNGIVCNDEKYQFDLMQFRITNPSMLCDLYLGVGVASAIKANYKYFNLVFDNTTTKYTKERIYTELLSMQTANYFLDGYEKLDKEYKAFKYLNRNSLVSKAQNWIDKHWWDYGYDKFMVIVNSFKLFLLFFAINLFVYKGLTKVYHPVKFKEFDSRLESDNVDGKRPVMKSIKKYFIRIPVIFLYTAFVFWGLKLDLKELEIKKPLYMTILISQYITGLVCLAYIANYIISK